MKLFKLLLVACLSLQLGASTVMGSMVSKGGGRHDDGVPREEFDENKIIGVLQNLIRDRDTNLDALKAAAAPLIAQLSDTAIVTLVIRNAVRVAAGIANGPCEQQRVIDLLRLSDSQGFSLLLGVIIETRLSDNDEIRAALNILNDDRLGVALKERAKIMVRDLVGALRRAYPELAAVIDIEIQSIQLLQHRAAMRRRTADAAVGK